MGVDPRAQPVKNSTLPTVFSILIYTHPRDRVSVVAICDGSYHTVMRTGASAAVSAKWLARKNSKTLAIVGAGHMAERRSRPATRFLPGTKRASGAARGRLLMRSSGTRRRNHRFPIHASRDLAEVVRGADVVVTVTPAREPLVKDEWIAPGTHIAAVGADKAGDQELDPRILQRARIFVDDIRQCRTDGEINVPLSKGLIREQDIAGEIGEVVTGKKQGRRSGDDITIFDSTGIALQDSATVPLEYKRAVEAGVGIEKKMIST